MLVCILCLRREPEKVYCLYTRENVDIFGWPLNLLKYIFFILLSQSICLKITRTIWMLRVVELDM